MKKGNESAKKEQAVVIPHRAEEPGGPGQHHHQGYLLHHKVSAEKVKSQQLIMTEIHPPKSQTFSLIFTHYDENNLRGSNTATIIKTTSTSFITVGLEKAVSANNFQVLALLSLEKSHA